MGWPLSRAVGTGEFYAARDQRTSVRASRVCLCVTAEQAPAIFSMGAGNGPRACGGSSGLRHAEESVVARLPYQPYARDQRQEPQRSARRIVDG